MSEQEQNRQDTGATGAQNVFSTELFGFRRDEVLRCIERMSQENMQRMRELDASIEALNADLDRSRKENSALGEENRMLRGRLEKAQQSVQDAVRQAEQARARIDQANDSLSACQSRLMMKTRECDSLKEENAKLEKQVEELTDSVEQFRAKREEAEQQTVSARREAEAILADARHRAEALRIESETRAARALEKSQREAQFVEAQAEQQRTDAKRTLSAAAQSIAASVTVLKERVSQVDENIAAAADNLKQATGCIRAALENTENDLTLLGVQMDKFPNTTQPIASAAPQPVQTSYEAQQAAYAQQYAEYERRLQEYYEQQKQYAYEQAQREAYEKAQREAYEKAQREAYEKAQREAYEKAQREAYEKAQREAYEKAQREAYEKAQRESFERWQREMFEAQRSEYERRMREYFEAQRAAYPPYGFSSAPSSAPQTPYTSAQPPVYWTQSVTMQQPPVPPMPPMPPMPPVYQPYQPAAAAQQSGYPAGTQPAQTYPAAPQTQPYAAAPQPAPVQTAPQSAPAPQAETTAAPSTPVQPVQTPVQTPSPEEPAQPAPAPQEGLTPVPRQVVPDVARKQNHGPAPFTYQQAFSAPKDPPDTHPLQKRQVVSPRRAVPRVRPVSDDSIVDWTESGDKDK